MKQEYIQDAQLLINHAQDGRFKSVQPRTTLPNKLDRVPLPSFTQMQDSFKNLVSGLGGSQAKANYTTYRTTFCFSDTLLYNLFESHGLSRKVIIIKAKDCTKNNIKIPNDVDGDLMIKWTKLKSIKHFKQADIYRGFFGGSIIYMDIDDGQDLTKPLNMNNIKSVNGLRTYCRTDVFFTDIHFNDDINSENYGQPEYYTIIPKYATPFNIHYSRVLEFKGLEVPSHLDNGYRYYWGQSELEPLWETLKKVGASLENLDQLLYEMTIAIYKIKGFADLVHGKQWDTIKNIIDQTELAKSTIRALLMDSEGQEYTRDSLNFAGVKDVIELLFTLLTGESSVPMIRLFGKQMGGLNNDASGELSGYYDDLKEHQALELTPQAQRLIDIINASKEIGNKKVNEPIVEFESPYQLDEKQKLENKKIQAEIDKIYVSDIGNMSEEENRELRMNREYSFSMNVTELDSYNENLISEREEQEEEQRESQLQMSQMAQEGNNNQNLNEENNKKPGLIQTIKNKLSNNKK